MNQRKHHTVFNELLNRYDSLFLSVIRKHFKSKEEAQDVYQDFLIHLLILVESHYETSIDLIHTASWLKAVVSNFCISALRQKNAKRRIDIDREGFSSRHIENYATALEKSPFVVENKLGVQTLDEEDVMNHLLGLLPKRDALILKMKYFYGKSSQVIGKKLHINHVDVKISRLKERLIKLSGINHLGGIEDYFINKF